MRDIYLKLKEAYSDKNLNHITGKLITLYKSGNFDQIRLLAERVSKYIPIDERKDSRNFTRLIMLYHPDKGASYREKIDRVYQNGNQEQLEEFSHILLMDEFEPTLSEMSAEDIGYSPGEEWDPSQSGYSYFTDTGEADIEASGYEPEFEGSFYEAVKMRMYGNLSQEFPPHYLEDFEDIEMADSQIEHLDGIEHCKHVTFLDLSGNLITDITDLWHLDRLEELYLGNNRIGFIDSLFNLVNLREVDLSGNDIDDISPLMRLEKLEFVNLIGNRVPEDQVRRIREKGVIIMI